MHKIRIMPKWTDRPQVGREEPPTYHKYLVDEVRVDEFEHLDDAAQSLDKDIELSLGLLDANRFKSGGSRKCGSLLICFRLAAIASTWLDQGEQASGLRYILTANP